MIEPIFQTKTESISQNNELFVFEPLHSSFASTIGNALRRTLLSSISGFGVSYVKVEGTSHLFSTISGVKESVLDIIMNLKKIRFICPFKDEFEMILQVDSEGCVYSKNFSGEPKVVDGDVYVAEITDKNASLKISMIVDYGMGYVPAEEREERNGYIALDTFYSPVKKVNYKVEEARVGSKSNYERLLVDVLTDGSVSPTDAMKQSVSVISSYFGKFFCDNKDNINSDGSSSEHKEESENKYYNVIIDELSLPSRVINALLRENIETVGDLLKRGKENLVVLKGVGRKSIDLVEEELKKMDIELK